MMGPNREILRDVFCVAVKYGKVVVSSNSDVVFETVFVFHRHTKYAFYYDNAARSRTEISP